MARRLGTGELVVASHNQDKLAEIVELLDPFGLDVRSAGDLGVPEPEETGATFVENAILKAETSAQATGQVALGDDSGLVVPDLDGQPGLHSARWAGSPRDFGRAMQRVADELAARNLPVIGTPAYFIAVMALAWPDGHVETVEGRVHGKLTWPPRGDRGFGYDPMFVADGHDVTFGEMDPDLKQRISHRSVAFAKLIDLCLKE